MILRLLLISFLSSGLTSTITINHMNFFSDGLLNGYELALPDDNQNDPDFIFYPYYPGNPGNYSNDLNMYNYFNNLYDYFPSNKGGTCSFVSTCQVLSFFDTFFNESIIPEQYEAKASLSSNNVNAASPGTLKDSLVFPYSSFSSHYDFVSATYNECFDSKMMRDYNISNGTYNSTYFEAAMSWQGKAAYIDDHFGQYHLETGICFDSSSPNYNASSYTISVQTIKNRMVNIFDENEFLLKAREVSYELFDDIIEYIDDGFPVLLSICQGFEQTINYMPLYPIYNNIGNHSVVAYDYEIINGEIVLYCNFGYGPNSTHLRYDDGDFEVVYAYVPIVYNYGIHYHSDNYIINNQKYCGCSHHTHTLSYSYVDAYKHSMICPCGFLDHENHSDNVNFTCCSGYIPGVL